MCISFLIPSVARRRFSLDWKVVKNVLKAPKTMYFIRDTAGTQARYEKGDCVLLPSPGGRGGKGDSASSEYLFGRVEQLVVANDHSKLQVRLWLKEKPGCPYQLTEGQRKCIVDASELKGKFILLGIEDYFHHLSYTFDDTLIYYTVTTDGERQG